MSEQYFAKSTLIKYLIEKQTSLENIDCINMAKDIGRVIKLIEQDNIPTTDMVVCKECIFYEEIPEAFTSHCRREFGYLYARPNGFCSYGERKE